ncbi:MAG TPA: hypothetical protein VMM80_08330 [Bacteroidota bacterium]|nr:hypothetical protein [Bacteroidota bacterium]
MATSSGRGVEPAEPRELERRYVYGGSAPAGIAGGPLRPNRPGVRRRVSTFNVMLLLFGIGGAIVFYINNILSINRLASETGQLEAELQKLEGITASLRTDVANRSALDRISTVAQSELGLRPSATQQIWFTIDRDRLGEIERARK